MKRGNKFGLFSALFVFLFLPCTANLAQAARYGGYAGLDRQQYNTPDIVLPFDLRIHPTTGNLLSTFSLFSRPADGIPIELFLAYNSDASTVDLPTGRGWRLSMYARYSLDANGNLYITWGDGHRDKHILGSSGYIPPIEHGGEKVILTGQDLVLTDHTGIVFRFATSTQTLRAMTDPLGRGWWVTQNSDGWPLAMTHSSISTSYTFTWSNRHLVRLQENDLNRSYLFGYNSSGDLVSIQDPAGQNFGWSYDSEGRLTTKTRPDGNSANITWNGALPATIQIGSRNWQLQFDAGTRKTTLTEPGGGTWRYRSNAQGRIDNIEDPLLHRFYYYFDGLGQLSSVMDRAGGFRRFYWDGHHNLTRSEDANSRFMLYRYDPFFDLPQEQENALGSVWRTDYNTFGLPLTATDPLGNRRHFFWNAKGQLTQTTSPLGFSTVYQYDARNNLNLVTYPDGTTKAFGYDAADRLTAIYDTRGSQVIFSWDVLDRMTSEAEPDGSTQLYTYNALGNVTTLRDRFGNNWNYVYDDLQQRIGATDPLGNSETWQYNGRGDLTNYTDRRGSTWSWTVNPLGLTTSLQPPAGGTWGFVYDNEGRITSRTGPDGNEIINYIYDSSGYPTFATYKFRMGTSPWNTDLNLQFFYDAAGNLIRGVEWHSSLQSNSWFFYDSSGRITETVSDGIDSTDRFESRYQYDAEGRLLRKWLPDGFRLGLTDTNYFAYQYDAMGRVVQHLATAYANDLSGAPGGTTQTIQRYHNNFGQVTMETVSGVFGGRLKTTRYLYEAAGTISMTTTAVPDFASIDHAFSIRYWRDAWQRVTQSTWIMDYPGDVPPRKVISSTRLFYDAMSRVTAQVEARQGDSTAGSSFFMFYDSAGAVTGGRYSSASGATASVEITRDTTGRVLTMFDSLSGTTSFAYNQYGQLTQEQGPDGGRKYYYDARNRLRQMEMPLASPTTSISMLYDTFSRLVRYKEKHPDPQTGSPLEYTKRFAYGSPTPVATYYYNVFNQHYERGSVMLWSQDPTFNESQPLAQTITSLEPPGIRGKMSSDWSGWSQNVIYPGTVANPKAPAGAGQTFFNATLNAEIPYPISVRWPQAPSGQSYDNPLAYDVLTHGLSENRRNLDMELGDPSPPAGLPTGVGNFAGSRLISTRPLTRDMDGVQNGDFAVDVNPCGGTSYRASPFGTTAHMNNPVPNGGPPDSDGLSRFMGTLNTGIELSKGIAKAGSKALGKYFTPVAAGVGAWQEYNLTRSYGGSVAGSALNAGGSFAFDLAYAAPGLLDSGISMVTGKDAGIVSTFKNAYRVPLACLQGNDEQLVDSMRSGQCGGITKALSNCGYKLGEAGYDVYHKGKTIANNAVNKVKSGYNSLRKSIKKRGVVGTMTHYTGRVLHSIGSLFGFGK